ncbi:hypothetical protein ARMGADRAFT_1016723 [Armillaria gallica]|uniref:Uncharacterized protein n=1 Tax=Armillaria gallica TaxID=47427 RepID=A0A2H3D830_ARMGA|nr:hypothetical protein ARMGADRAFT_1020923 [Armillaria gallica]PBK87592.1 hypothetical protein ARMGADRAFT_1016723 [Armillaria gallica]
MAPVRLEDSLSDAACISSVADSVAYNPGIFICSCLVFIFTTAFKKSPSLSSRAQLGRLNSTIDDTLALFKSPDEDIDLQRRVPRCGEYIHLKQVQINACLSEICLLRAEKDDTSWREYFRSIKKCTSMCAPF